MLSASLADGLNVAVGLAKYSSQILLVSQPTLLKLANILHLGTGEKGERGKKGE